MIKNVLEYLKESAKKYPDKVGFCDQEESVTFSEMNIAAKKIATQIINQCIEIENRPIAVYMDKKVASISAFLGIVYSGNFYVPLDVKSPINRIEKIFEILQPKVIITQEKYLDKIKSCYDKAQLLVIDQQIDIDEERLASIEKKHLDINPLYVLFTSGSTGVPKGVVISHKAVIDYTEWLTDFFGFDESMRFGNQTPFYFDMSVLDIYCTLKNAATMFVIPEKLFVFPNELMKYLEKNMINTIFWVPSAMIGVANSNALQLFNCQYLKKILFAGEVMPNKQLNIWRKYIPDALFANLYGPTEITVICACYVVNREFEDDEALPIGYACNNMELLVLNEEDRKCMNDEVGELCVRGTGVAMGYFANKEKTAEAFVQNPLNACWNDIIYRTGDLVFYNSYGELIFLGRKDYQIKHNGYRIELGEIEKAACSLSGIKQACALYHTDSRQIILAVICEEEITEREIYITLKKKIPRYMLPAQINILEKFPLNANGKIDRKELKSFLVEKYESEPQMRPARSKLL